MHEQARLNPEEFNVFHGEFGHFLKEGICTDATHRDEIAKLLRFESSKVGVGELVSLDEYTSRMLPDHKKIYYLTAPSRELAERSPYFEIFRKTNTEIIFCYTDIDDFVMTNLVRASPSL